MRSFIIWNSCARAGWLDSVQDETFISLRVSEEKRRSADEFLCKSGAPQGARENCYRGPARIVWIGEVLAASAVCRGGKSAAIGGRCRRHSLGTAADASVSTAISAEMRRTPVDLTGKTAIADLPALLSQCHLFIGNDSGAMHVAAAVGLPVIAVFGPTDPEGTAPVTPRCSIVQQKSYCSPCFLRRCPTDHRCLTAITANMVEAAARPWLHSTPGAACFEQSPLRPPFSSIADGTIAEEVGYLNHTSRFRMFPLSRLLFAG